LFKRIGNFYREFQHIIDSDLACQPQDTPAVGRVRHLCLPHSRPGVRVCGLWFVVWGFEFGVWGLGFGVSGFGSSAEGVGPGERDNRLRVRRRRRWRPLRRVVLPKGSRSSLWSVGRDTHGGIRPLNQKSTCLHPINFRALCGLNFVTPPPKFGGHETLVLHSTQWTGSYESLRRARQPLLVMGLGVGIGLFVYWLLHIIVDCFL